MSKILVKSAFKGAGNSGIPARPYTTVPETSTSGLQTIFAKAVSEKNLKKREQVKKLSLPL